MIVHALALKFNPPNGLHRCQTSGDATTLRTSLGQWTPSLIAPLVQEIAQNPCKIEPLAWPCLIFPQQRKNRRIDAEYVFIKPNKSAASLLHRHQLVIKFYVKISQFLRKNLIFSLHVADETVNNRSCWS
jgi:hypothetical protein